MKIYDFIKELKDGGVKFSHLKTLDIVIGELENYVNESNNGARAWHLMTLYRAALKEPLQLYMFVPCYSNGNPMNDISNVSAEQLEQAKSRILFDGWRWVCKEVEGQRVAYLDSEFLTISNLTFDVTDNVYHLCHPAMLSDKTMDDTNYPKAYLGSIESLAEATQFNKLKFK